MYNLYLCNCFLDVRAKQNKLEDCKLDQEK